MSLILWGRKRNYFGHVGSYSRYRRGGSFSAGDYWNVLPAPHLVVQKDLEDSRTRGSGCYVKPSRSPACCIRLALLLRRCATAQPSSCSSPRLCSPACVSYISVFPHLYTCNLPREPEELRWSAGKGFDKSLGEKHHEHTDSLVATYQLHKWLVHDYLTTEPFSRKTP